MAFRDGLNGPRSSAESSLRTLLLGPGAGAAGLGPTRLVRGRAVSEVVAATAILCECQHRQAMQLGGVGNGWVEPGRSPVESQTYPVNLPSGDRGAAGGRRIPARGHCQGRSRRQTVSTSSAAVERQVGEVRATSHHSVEADLRGGLQGAADQASQKPTQGTTDASRATLAAPSRRGPAMP